MTFNQTVRQILEDREIQSPYPFIFKLERTDNDLYKRTYFKRKKRNEEIVYTKDKEGNVFHNLDGPAVSFPETNTNFYWIDGEPLLKDQWEKKRLTYNIKDKSDRSDADDLLDI